MHSGLDRPLEEAQGRDQAQQAPERAQIAAPEARGQPAQGDDPGKDQERDQRHVEDRLGVGQRGDVHPAHGLGQGRTDVQEEIDQADERREEDESVDAGQEGMRVQEVDSDEPHQGRR